MRGLASVRVLELVGVGREEGPVRSRCRASCGEKARAGLWWVGAQSGRSPSASATRRRAEPWPRESGVGLGCAPTGATGGARQAPLSAYAPGGSACPDERPLPRRVGGRVRDLEAATERGATQSLPPSAASAEAFAPAPPGRLRLSLEVGLAAGGGLGPRGGRRVLPAPPPPPLPVRPARRPSAGCCRFREAAI